jgi:hypothetical protein
LKNGRRGTKVWNIDRIGMINAPLIVRPGEAKLATVSVDSFGKKNFGDKLATSIGTKVIINKCGR